MIKKNLKMFVVLATVMVLLFATSGCMLSRPVIRVGQLQTRSESIKLDDAKSGNVEIDFAVGELKVSGGANDLLQAKFNFNIAQLEPQVANKSGTLSVLTPDVERAPISLVNAEDFRNEWDLQLNDSKPMKMHVVLGAGSADLKLGSLSLTRFDLNAGAGPVYIDLTGNRQADLDATITGGLGEITLQLPNSPCVQVDVTRGLGGVNAYGLIKDGNTYTNAACGKPGAIMRIDIGAGVGDINLEAEG